MILKGFFGGVLCVCFSITITRLLLLKECFFEQLNLEVDMPFLRAKPRQSHQNRKERCVYQVVGSAKEESIVRYSAHTTCPVLSPEPGSLVWYTNACMLSRFSCICFFATPWTVTCQAPLSMGFSRQEYWSGLPFPTPGDLPNPGIKAVSLKSPALETLPPPGKPHHSPVSSVTQSCLTLRPHGQQHVRLPRPSPTRGACSNSCPSSSWCCHSKHYKFVARVNQCDA